MIGQISYSDTALSDCRNTIDLGQAIWDIRDHVHEAPLSGPGRVMDTIAAGLSAEIRRQGNASAAVSGKTLRQESFVRARWGWAILPVTLVALACSFMIATLVVTARNGTPIWKSSALATLAHGMNEGLCASITAGRLDMIERNAQGHRMGMSRIGRQWILESAGS